MLTSKASLHPIQCYTLSHLRCSNCDFLKFYGYFCGRKVAVVFRKVMEGLRFDCGRYGSIAVFAVYICGPLRFRKRRLEPHEWQSGYSFPVLLLRVNLRHMQFGIAAFARPACPLPVGCVGRRWKCQPRTGTVCSLPLAKHTLHTCRRTSHANTRRVGFVGDGPGLPPWATHRQLGYFLRLLSAKNCALCYKMGACWDTLLFRV